MSGRLIHLSPKVSPNEFHQSFKDVDLVPSGTGLQIIFKIDGENYLIAGPRSDKVLSVNGGSVEDPDQPFFIQLMEEMQEETFGVLKLEETNEGYKLTTFEGRSHPITFLETHSFMSHKPGRYAYITFTAICDTATLDELIRIADRMTFTAKFWNRIGNYLFSHVSNNELPKDDRLDDYWKKDKDNRSLLITSLIQEGKLLLAKNLLLINPCDVFKAPDLEEALSHLHAIHSYSDLMRMFKHTVGRYSERAGYYVFNSADLFRATQDNNPAVCDIRGQQAASGIFNNDSFATVFSELNIIAQHDAATRRKGSINAAQINLFYSANKNDKSLKNDKKDIFAVFNLTQ
jgi:hypothetical protein